MTRPLVMPQRIVSPAPVLRKQRPDGRRDISHLAAVRLLPCLKCGIDPCGEAAHVRWGSYSMARKPPDSSTVPLCRSCHLTDYDAQHKVGERAFWNALGINPRPVAGRLYDASPEVPRMRAIVFATMADAKRENGIG